MGDIESVSQAIQNAGEALNGDLEGFTIDTLEGYAKKIQLDAVFRCAYLFLQYLFSRRDCAGNSTLWKAIYCALDPAVVKKLNFSERKIEVLQVLIRLVQFVFAGVSTVEDENNVIVVEMFILPLFH
jgi:hypothetical protein